MATKTFRINWQVSYKASSNSRYSSGQPILVGSTANYQTFIGIPSAVRDAIKTSKTATNMRLRLYINNASLEWDLGKHKLTSAPTSSTMPWYTYEKAFHETGTGWKEFDLSGSVFEDEYKAGTYQGIVLYSGSTSSHYGEAYNTSTYPMSIEVDGDWNDPPASPVITYPKGGEVVDSSITIKWNKPSDPDGDNLRYKIAIEDNTGWKYSGYTAYGATSYTWNTSGLKETSSASVAVLANDGQVDSPWRYSNNFTISHNQAPTAPTNLSPTNGAVKDRTENIRLSWKHNDDGAQAGFRINWRLKGTTTWNYYPNSTTFKSSTNQYYDFSANTFPFGDIEWGVRTLDQQSKESPIATSQIFFASNPTNAPTILKPVLTDGFYNSSNLVIEWSSLNQIEYEVILYNSDGVELWRQSGAGSTKMAYPSVQLANSTGYEVHVRSKDSTTLIWSDYSVLAFVTSFTPPVQPILQRIETAGEGVFNIFYSASDVNFLPDLIIGNGEYNPQIVPYNAGSVIGENIVINSPTSFTKVGAGQYGLQSYLNVEHIPEGTKVRAELVSDVQGARIYLEGKDASGGSLGLTATFANKAETTAGLLALEYTLPAGCVEVRVIYYTTWDSDTTVNYTDLKLFALAQTPTDSIDVFRRDFTPTDTAPWIKIGEGLTPSGTFLEYTPASGAIYEYKVRAVSNEGTMVDSNLSQASTTFDDTMLQEANNLSNIAVLGFATSRDQVRKVDSSLMKFAGRIYPVREFGENEELTLNVTWEVDSYGDVLRIEEMIQRRDVLLYRDKNGRRFWVTTDKVNVTDKDLTGFELSAEFEMTDFIEDLTRKGEGDA
jgi:hypothetical protein